METKLFNIIDTSELVNHRPGGTICGELGPKQAAQESKGTPAAYLPPFEDVPYFGCQLPRYTTCS
jgi:hypothetical protein